MNLEMPSWKTLSRQTILDRGKFLRVENHVIQLPDGRKIEEWPWIVTPDFVNIVAITEDGHYLLFKQTKYSIEGSSFAPVGGYIDQGEDPLNAAKRELLEETGYNAPQWHSLGSFPVDGNRGAGKAHFFLALKARQETNMESEIESDDLEEQQLFLFRREEVATALQNGQFKLLPWAASIALALHYKS